MDSPISFERRETKESLLRSPRASFTEGEEAMERERERSVTENSLGAYELRSKKEEKILEGVGIDFCALFVQVGKYSPYSVRIITLGGRDNGPGRHKYGITQSGMDQQKRHKH